MTVPTVIADLSATAASNSPAGSDAVFPGLDDYLRAAFAFIRQGDTKASDIASASTVDLGAAAGRIVDVTGTTTITSFGTVDAGVWRIVRFTGALTITHNATSLILPGGDDVTTASGDCYLAISLGSGNWYVAALSTDASRVTYLPSGTGAVPRTAESKLREVVSVKDFGAVGDGVTDDTAALQAALDAAQYKTLYVPKGTYSISAPLNVKTQTRIVGDGIASIIKASGSWAASAPGVAAGIYTPTLSYAPLLYNASPIQWFSIEGITLHGNDKDCYGLWLMENFYGTIKDVYVLNTNKRPYTNIRGQAVVHINFVAYQCGDGCLSYDNTNFSFIGGGFERLSGAWSYDQRQPNSFAKGGVSLDDVWFESDSSNFPTDGFLRMSGRRNRASIHANFHATATTERALELNDTTSSISADGITMGAYACVMGDFVVNNAAGAMLINAAAGSYGNRIRGAFTASKVTDDGAGNTFDVNGSLATPVQHVTGRWQVRYGDTGSGIPLTAANYVIDVDHNAGTPIIRLLGNVNNAIDLTSGNLRLTSNLGQRFVCMSGSVAFSATQYAFEGASGATGYQKPVYLGSYAMWVDSGGKLRVKSGAPASDTDGTVVGTQT